MMRSYKELSDLRNTEAEEIAHRFRLNEGYRDEGLYIKSEDSTNLLLKLYNISLCTYRKSSRRTTVVERFRKRRA